MIIGIALLIEPIPDGSTRRQLSEFHLPNRFVRAPQRETDIFNCESGSGAIAVGGVGDLGYLARCTAEQNDSENNDGPDSSGHQGLS
jgi:hypothetical protein